MFFRCDVKEGADYVREEVGVVEFEQIENQSHLRTHVEDIERFFFLGFVCLNGRRIRPSVLYPVDRDTCEVSNFLSSFKRRPSSVMFQKAQVVGGERDERRELVEFHSFFVSKVADAFAGGIQIVDCCRIFCHG